MMRALIPKSLGECVLLALFIWFLVAVESKAQSLQISGIANKVMVSGLDTTTVERAFCLWWHDVDHEPPFTKAERDTVVIDSAFAAKTIKADSLHVTYNVCPRGMATAHWHLLDMGAVNFRTPRDSEALVLVPAPFGVLILRGHRGDRYPSNWVYYDR